jgi:catechol 2,3-dioxygenase-like lactoylglutathione lyase family enzyme
VIVSRLAHVALDVEDLDAVVAFYTDLLGLAVIEESSGSAYLACGASNTYELVLRQGEHRFDHFAFAVRGEAALEEVRERCTQRALDFVELDVDGEPGLSAGIETSLPSGHVLRLVAEADPSGFRVRPAYAPIHHRGVGPVALEHITLLCGDIGAAAAFGLDLLDLQLSDSVQPPGAPWGNTHLRAGVLHHDLGLLPGDAPAMHHFAFAVPSVSEVVAAADAIAARGMAVDCSIGRHVAGNNVFIYFKDPAGHRLEVNTDMARVDAAAPPHVVESPIPFDAWRPGRPPALAGGSPARERVLQRRP